MPRHARCACQVSCSTRRRRGRPTSESHPPDARSTGGTSVLGRRATLHASSRSRSPRSPAGDGCLSGCACPRSWRKVSDSGPVAGGVAPRRLLADCLVREFRRNRDAVDFDHHPARQPRGLHRGSRRQAFAQVPSVDFVHLGEVRHIAQEHRRLEDLLHR